MNTYNGINGILATADWERLFDLDLQLLADSVLTLIAVFVLFLAGSYLFFNPARKMLQGRKDKIAADIDAAKSDKAEAAELKAEYEAKLSNVDTEVNQILAEARKKALDNEMKILNEAREEAGRIMDRANNEVELEKQKLADDVKKEIVSVASVMAGKIVTSSMNSEIQDGLIDETLKEMGESTWLS